MAKQPGKCSDRGKSEAMEGLTEMTGIARSLTLYIIKSDYLEAGKNRKIRGT